MNRSSFGFVGAAGLALVTSLLTWSAAYGFPMLIVGFVLVGGFVGLLARGWPGALGTGLGVLLSFPALSLLWYGLGFRTFLGDPTDMFWWPGGTLVTAGLATVAMVAFGVVRAMAGRKG